MIRQHTLRRALKAVTRTWSVFSGSATISNPSAANLTAMVTAFGPPLTQQTITSSTFDTTTDDGVLSITQQPTANAGLDQAKCQAASGPTVFNLSGTATNGTPTWSVLGGDATITNGNTLTPIVNVTGLGTVTVGLAVAGGIGSTTAMVVVTLTVNANPATNAGLALSEVSSGERANHLHPELHDDQWHSQLDHPAGRLCGKHHWRWHAHADRQCHWQRHCECQAHNHQYSYSELRHGD